MLSGKNTKDEIKHIHKDSTPHVMIIHHYFLTIKSASAMMCILPMLYGNMLRDYQMMVISINFVSLDPDL